MVVSRRSRRVLAAIAPAVAIVAAVAAHDHLGVFTHIAVVMHPLGNKWW